MNKPAERYHLIDATCHELVGTAARKREACEWAADYSARRGVHATVYDSMARRGSADTWTWAPGCRAPRIEYREN